MLRDDYKGRGRGDTRYFISSGNGGNPLSTNSRVQHGVLRPRAERPIDAAFGAIYTFGP
jgi:hypothetical protein